MDKEKKHVLVLFGGESTEHEASVISARDVVAAIDKGMYCVTLVGITKHGLWAPFTEDELNSDELSTRKLNAEETVLHTIEAFLESCHTALTQSEDGVAQPVDVVFPMLHGTLGEDGAIQGLLTLAGVPFVGSGILSSAIGMDKEFAKRIVKGAGIPTARWLTYTIEQSDTITFAAIKKTLGTPVFVKPSSLGSSIAVHKVHDEKELFAAINNVFLYGPKVLIEESIEGTEVQCSVLGNADPKASPLGSFTKRSDFYSNEVKHEYSNESLLTIPADLTKAFAQKIQKLAVQVFKALGCRDMTRVDFFVTDSGKIYLNEVNTIPGFTTTSTYPKLWEHDDVTYAQLVNKLIALAIERSDKQKSFLTSHV